MISVIIPTYNRADLLALATKSLCLQDFPCEQFEVLVVDNDSTDNTKQVVEETIAVHASHQIRYLYEPMPGLLSGRHRGALEAKGDILTFIDDDIEADSNWLQAIKETFDDPSVQIVGGRNLPKYESPPPEWLEWFWSDLPYGRTCAYLSLLDFGNQMRVIDTYFVWGLNFSIRKQALFDLGGFHPDCIPKHLQHFQGDGELGLAQRAKQYGYNAIYNPAALVFHWVPKDRMSYEYFDQRCFYQGVCDSYSEIRRTQAIMKSKPLTLKIRLKNILRNGKTTVRKFVKKRTQEELLKERFASAYQEGYQFHQNAVRASSALLKWVLRKDYWDYTLPALSMPENAKK